MWSVDKDSAVGTDVAQSSASSVASASTKSRSQNKALSGRLASQEGETETGFSVLERTDDDNNDNK